MDGVLTTKEVKEHYPDIKITILTTFDDDEFIHSALRHGASGYLLKEPRRGGLPMKRLSWCIRAEP